MLLDGSDLTSLMQLSWYWEKSYRISVIDDVWQAVPHDNPDDVITADDAWSLRMLLRQDAVKRRREMMPED